MMLHREGLRSIAKTDTDRPYRIAVFVPTGAGQARDGYRHIGLQQLAGTNGHLLRCLAEMG